MIRSFNIKNTQQRALFWPALFFLSLFVVLGCEKEDFTNTGYLPDNETLSFFTTDTLTLEAATKREDSVVSSNYLYQLLGSINHPNIGESKAGLVTQLLPGELDPGIDPNDVAVDSVVLYLDIDRTYSDNPAQDVEVYEITENLNPDQDYFSNYIPSHNATPIGIVSGIAVNTTDSTVIDGQTFAPSLKIPLNKAFGEKVLIDANNALVTNEDFTNAIKGIMVKSTSTFPSGEGGIVILDLLSGSTFLKIFYRSKSTGVESSYNLIVEESVARYSLFEHNFSGTEVEQAIQNPAYGNNKAFVLSMAGTYVEVEIPHLKALAAQPILVHKAELVMPVENDQNEPYPPHQQLLIAKVTEEGEEEITPDQLEGGSHFGGQYNETTEEIKLRITRSVQEMVNDARNNQSINPVFHLIPGDLSTGGGAVNAFRTILAGTDNPALNRRMKIIISYTPVN